MSKNAFPIGLIVYFTLCFIHKDWTNCVKRQKEFKIAEAKRLAEMVEPEPVELVQEDLHPDNDFFLFYFLKF